MRSIFIGDGTLFENAVIAAQPLDASCHFNSSIDLEYKLLGQAKKDHSGDDGPAEGFGCDGEQEGRDGDDELGPAGVNRLFGAISNQCRQQYRAQYGSRNKVEPLHQP